MKTPVVLIMLFMVVTAIAGCRKDKGYMSETAVITGYDLTLCACCGGLMINFDNDPVPRHGSYSLIDEMPVGAGIDAHSTFPIYVKVSWKLSAQCGNQTIIDITKISRR